MSRGELCQGTRALLFPCFNFNTDILFATLFNRCIEHLLSNQVDTQCEIWASYLQIYCETITDLLWQPSNTEALDPAAPTRIVAYSANQPLMLRERATGSAQGTTGAGASGVYVEGLSRYKVQSAEDLVELLNR